MAAESLHTRLTRHTLACAATAAIEGDRLGQYRHLRLARRLVIDEDAAMTFVDPRRLINHRRFQPDRTESSEPPIGSGVRRIVLTGGPGSGKSTAAAFLAREFVEDLWVLPES
ncbi:MAG: hypothetical protein JWM25_1014, partial [Thermoleophilia bacterium]|nr:hypothetical protein [Thermoleophilia bacterium]